MNQGYRAPVKPGGLTVDQSAAWDAARSRQLYGASGADASLPDKRSSELWKRWTMDRDNGSSFNAGEEAFAELARDESEGRIVISYKK